ncbi:MAG: phospholipase D-like domain-containing protein [Ktedonobacterales bacterium]
MAAHGTAYSFDGVDVYFQSRRAGLEAGLADRLAQFIRATQQTLDCAIYDLRDLRILQALADVAQSAGKTLRIAYDPGKERAGNAMVDPKPAGAAELIAQFGLDGVATPVREGSRNLMHDKFLVRDGSALWMGSANFTEGGLDLQDNNCLVYRNAPDLASQYKAVFEDLISPNHHHPTPSESETAHDTGRAVKVGHATITPFFEPEGGEAAENAVVAALQGAQKVRIMAFLISDLGILQTLKQLNDSGADISGVLDPGGMKDAMRGTHKDPALFWFVDDPRFAHAPSHPFSPHRENDFMHNKVMIVDDHRVLTGSYNFSENAEANDENMLQIDSAEIANAYTAYFETLFVVYPHGGQG